VRFGSIVAIFILCTAACGEIDECLDHGGRWNEFVSVCEFTPGPLTTTEDAIAAATRTLEFAYGSRVLDQTPFTAELNLGVWHVYGSLPDGVLGGVAEAWIDAETGSVQKVVHGQ
jgi:hypothetical protein